MQRQRLLILLLLPLAIAVLYRDTYKLALSLLQPGRAFRLSGQSRYHVGKNRVMTPLKAVSTVIADTAGYPKGLSELLMKPAPYYVLFSSDIDTNTQLPWCPDCVRTLPGVQAAVSAQGGSLLEVRVGPRTAWRNSEHPFRLDPLLRLTGIPTLFHINSDGIIGERAGPDLERASGPDEAFVIATAFVKKTSS